MAINQGTVNKLEINYNPTTEFIRGYGGGVVRALGETGPISLRIGECNVEVTLLVVPDSVQEVPLLVGQPFTEHEQVMVIKDAKTLSFLKCPKSTKNKKALINLRATIIPPKYIGYIECQGDGQEELYVPESVRLRENEEAYIPDCIIGCNGETCYKIPLINLGNKDIIIQPGKLIARGISCKLETGEINSIQRQKMAPLSKEQINWGSSLTPMEVEELMRLINEYRDCFAVDLKEVGCTAGAELKIDLTSEEPVRYRPYRMPYSERRLVNEMVLKLKEVGIISDSESPYASPILLVAKPNGEKRLCVDFRKLNKITKKDRHPLPHMEDQIDQLRSYKFFTTLDMFSGYYQIPVAQESREKTAFVTADGHYQFNRMPFGLTNAPSVFQRLVNKIFRPLESKMATPYLDDIICPSTTFAEGLENLKTVFVILRENNLTLNPEKCNFFRKSIRYLGFEIDQEGVRPGPLKIQTVRDFPTPKDIHGVRQFLGLSGFFRRFIEKYAAIAKPLTQLLRKDSRWKWQDEEEMAFQTLKQKLTSRPILAIYNPAARTEVHTDASQAGIAGIILQEQESKLLKPIGYFSRQTNVCESKYHSYELETLAVVETLKRYRTYLLGLTFKIVTDCSAIKTAAEKKDLIPRIARWWLQLQEYDFSVEHRAGVKMSHVDALSRNATTTEEADMVDNFIFRIETEDWLLAGQLTDEKLKVIAQILENSPKDPYEKSIHKDYFLRENRIYRKHGNSELWVVPQGMRKEVVKACHDDFGHFGLDKTLSKLLETYWFSNLKVYVQKYIASCIPCLYNKNKKGKQEGYLHPIEKVPIPFHTIHVDHLGPFNPSSGGKKYIFVIIDAFTKFILLTATKDTKTAPVLRALRQLVNVYGVPTRVVSDQGTAFTSHAFNNFCKNLGLKHIKNAVATPRANGQVERYNSTLLAALSTTIQEEREWEKALAKVQFSMNNTINSSTGKTPSEVLMGYKPRSEPDAKITNEIQPARPTCSNLSEVRKEIVLKTRKQQQQQKDRYDRKRKSPRRYKEADLVVVKKPKIGEGSKKLLPNYKGPFRITKRLPNDRYLVEEIVGSTRSRGAKFRKVEAVDHLKPWVPGGGVSSEDEAEPLAD